MRIRNLQKTLLTTVAFAALALNGNSAGAQERTAENAAADLSSGIETVVVTGVRGQRRTVADSPVPIDVLSGHQLQENGRGALKEVFQDVDSVVQPAWRQRRWDILGGAGNDHARAER